MPLRVSFAFCSHSAPFAFLALAAGLCAPAAAQPVSNNCPSGAIVVTGTVHKVDVISLVPLENPDMTFTLQSPSCGDTDIQVIGPPPIYCGEGDHARVYGNYVPATDLSRLPTLDGAQVMCETPEQAGEDAKGASGATQTPPSGE